MKALIAIVQFIFMAIITQAQGTLLNYMSKNNNNDYVFTVERISEGESKVEKKVLFTNKGDYIERDGLRIYLNVDSVAVPIIGEEELKKNIKIFLENELKADYEFTSHLYVIISETGDLIEIGIRSSRGDYYYEYKMTQFLVGVKRWNPAVYQNKKVCSIRLFRFNVNLN